MKQKNQILKDKNIGKSLAKLAKNKREGSDY